MVKLQTPNSSRTYNDLLIFFRTVSIILAFFLFLGLASAALAQTFDAKVSFFDVPPPNDQPYNVGDRIRLRLEVRHPADSQIDLPTLVEGELWGDFEVIDQTTTETSRRGQNVAITRKDFVVTLFEPGQYQTPRLLVTHQKTDGSTEELAAPVIQLDVDSVLVEEDTELRDIKAQAILPVPPIWPWILLLSLVFLGVVGVFAASGFWFYHRWKQKAIDELPLPVPVDSRPPEVIAYTELDRIESLDLPQAKRFKEHYTLVTDCLRRYIEGRFHIPALERTTDELRTSFRNSPVAQEHKQHFLDIFSDSDLVKFARFRPDPDDAYQLVNEARAVIKITTPTPPDPIAEQKPKSEAEEVAL